MLPDATARSEHRLFAAPGWIALACALLILQGCPGVTQIATAIASSAPPAQRATVYKVEGGFSASGSSTPGGSATNNVFCDRTFLNLYVTTGLYNTVTLTQNGAPITEIQGGDPLPAPG